MAFQMLKHSAVYGGGDGIEIPEYHESLGTWYVYDKVTFFG